MPILSQSFITVVIVILEILAVCKIISWFVHRKKEYSCTEYNAAEMLMDKYERRAIDVYKAIDPEMRLMPPCDTDVDITFSYGTWIYEKGEESQPTVFLQFEWLTDEYEIIDRKAIFPFSLMNLNLDDKNYIQKHIDIKVNERSHPYGGGGHCWLIFKVKA